jgi:hypothetical protein
VQKVYEYMGFNEQQINNLLVLIQNEDEYEDFARNFWNYRDKPTVILGRYREYKLQQNQMSVEQFLGKCEENKLKALEKLFQHQVIEWDLKYLEKQQEKYGFTLEDLYHAHMTDRKKMLLTWLSAAKTIEYAIEESKTFQYQ